MAFKLGLRKILFSFSHKRTGTDTRETTSLDSLYHTISYHFRDETYVRQALIHRSFQNNEGECRISNERLEFLGDAVLGLIVTDELYSRFPDWSEGELTKAKSYIVSRKILADKAKQIGLGQYLLLGSGEERSGGRNRHSILSDAYEALLGAIYLDGGLDKVRQFLSWQLLDDIDRLLDNKFHHNYKSWLLEHVQAEGKINPEYTVLKETGPDHEKEFTVEVHVNGQVVGRGKGYSKKSAEQQAALNAIRRMESRDEARELRCLEGGEG